MSNRSYLDGVQERQLGLDANNKKLGGVCAGVAHYLDVPSIVVRVVALVALCLATEATLIGYGLAYLIIDEIDYSEDITDVYPDEYPDE